MLEIIITTFVASVVTGMAGYGFSSITVPIGLQFFKRVVLNPAIVLIEIGSNAYTVYANRKSLPSVWRSSIAIIVGLAPGAVLGAIALPYIPEEPARVATFVFLGVLVIFRSAGVKKAVKFDGKTGVAFGGTLGFIYSLTTISGPPLSVALTNDGYNREDLKALIGIIRTTESIITGFMYLYLGFFNTESLQLFMYILPGVVIGMPLGHVIAERVNHDLFRRLCIVADVWLISFGLFRLLPLPLGTSIGVSLIAFDALKFRKFMRERGLKTPAKKEEAKLPKAA